MAACLAAGIWGIEHGLTLDAPETIGSGYAVEGVERLPRTLQEATARLAASAPVRSLLGDAFVTPIWAWKYLPIAVAVMGYLMASRLPMPKVGIQKQSSG